MDKAINLRMSGSMHTRLQLEAVNRGTSMQNILHSAAKRELGGDKQDSAKQFAGLAASIMRSNGTPEDVCNKSRHGGALARNVAKAAVDAQNWDTLWTNGEGRKLAAGFMESLAPVSVLDAVAPNAIQVPNNARVGTLHSGLSTATHVEGEPIAITRMDLQKQTMTEKSIAALVVMSELLLRGTGGEAAALVERELRKQVARATNDAFLNALSITSATSGATALESLRAGLDALGAANNIVVAADYDVVRELSLSSDTMPITGGVYRPGLRIIPVEGASMHVINADEIILDAGVLGVMPSISANVLMSDDPQAALDAADPGAEPPVLNPQPVSLFQTNQRAVRCIREFAVYGSAIKVA